MANSIGGLVRVQAPGRKADDRHHVPTEAGREVVRWQAATAELVRQYGRPGKAEKVGLGYAVPDGPCLAPGGGDA
jgi:hypothetical protein